MSSRWRDLLLGPDRRVHEYVAGICGTSVQLRDFRLDIGANPDRLWFVNRRDHRGAARPDAGAVVRFGELPKLGPYCARHVRRQLSDTAWFGNSSRNLKRGESKPDLDRP